MRVPLTILSGTSHPALALEAAQSAGVTLTDTQFHRHADSEIHIEIRENVRGHDVFVIQSTSSPANDHIMELLITLDALRRASADRITAVIPYFGYARQDRKTKPRQPISAKLVANIIVAAGADRVLSMDLHSGQMMGFFDIPVDHMYARPVILKHLKNTILKNQDPKEIVVVSPDAGGVSRARAYAQRLDASLAIIDKRRVVSNQVAEMHVVGDVQGKIAILVDDMIDTGSTLVKAAEALQQEGAREIYAACGHGVLSGNAAEKLAASPLKKIFITNSIAHSILPEKFTVLSVGPLLGEAIRRIHEESSVSSLFEGE
jgi:ribose-phosphate pyrophosphokinase